MAATNANLVNVMGQTDQTKQNFASMASGVTGWQGWFYVADAGGEAILPSNGTGTRPLGFAYLTYAEEVPAMFLYNCRVRIPLAGVTIAALRANVYATSDNVFSLTPGAAGNVVGQVVEVFDGYCDVDVTLIEID